MQWGCVPRVFDDRLVKVMFNITFPHKVMMITANCESDRIFTNVGFSSPNIDTNHNNSYFYLNTDAMNTNNGVPQRVFWFAIGY